MMVKKTFAIENEPTDAAIKTPFADLENLALQAEKNEASGEAENVAAEAKNASQETNTLAGEIEDALNMAAPFAEAGMWWLKPEQFEALWGASTRKKIAAAAAAVMLKHGWSLGAVLEKYAPYIALGMAFAPSAVATVQAYKIARAEQAQTPGGTNATTP